MTVDISLDGLSMTEKQPVNCKQASKECFSLLVNAEVWCDTVTPNKGKMVRKSIVCSPYTPKTMTT